MTTSLSVIAAGAMTPVGLSSEQTCTAVRAGISAYGESGFLLQGVGWEPVISANLPLRPRAANSTPNGRFLALAKHALAECVAQTSFNLRETAILIGIPEPWRLDLFRLRYSEDLQPFLTDRLLRESHPSSRLLPFGNVSTTMALGIVLTHL
jgi:hypothetical protein